MRADVRRRIYLRGSGDDSGGMNSGGKFLFREKQRERLGKGNAGVRHANENFLRRIKPLVGDDGGGRAVFGPRKKLLVFREGQVAGLGAVSGREAVQGSVAVTDDFALCRVAVVNG